MFSYRKPNLWSSAVTVQLTQQGFPEGRVLEKDDRRGALIQLAPLYAQLVNTKQVRERMRELGPIKGKVGVQPVIDQNRSVDLPLIQIASFAYTGSAAATRVKRQSDAFIDYIAQQQVANVRTRQPRASQGGDGPTAPAIVVPRKITLPVIVFLSMLIVTGGLILTLENLGGAAPPARRSRRRRCGPRWRL